MPYFMSCNEGNYNDSMAREIMVGEQKECPYMSRIFGNLFWSYHVSWFRFMTHGEFESLIGTSQVISPYFYDANRSSECLLTWKKALKTSIRS